MLVKTMDDKKVTTSRRTDDRERETLHEYVGGVISNPEPGKKKGRKEETDTSSGTGAKER